MMDQLVKDMSDCENVSNAAELPSGKSSPSFLCQDKLVINHSSYIKLQLDCAQYELNVAEAMKRAAEAKRLAAAALRLELNPNVEEVKVDDEIITRLQVSCSENDPPAVEEPKSDGYPHVPSNNNNNADEKGKVDELLARLELPRCEIPHFDGSPVNYVLFFRQFEEQIESRIRDNSQRLTYLYHYCQGKAKDAIRGCLLYPADQGYKRARLILKELFGRRHLIVKALLDEVTDSEPITLDADQMSSFANKLISCADALEQLGFLADLNSLSTIERVLSKLPRFLTIDWVKRADEIYQNDREPTFRDLCDFVCAKARLHRNRYSYLLRDRRVDIVRPDKGVLSQRRMYTISASKTVCGNCDGDHALEDCKEFSDLSVKERWALVSRLKLCFVCLRGGHQAQKCRSVKRCTEVGCKRLHHYLLHQTDNVSRVLNTASRRLSSEYGVSLGTIPVIVEGPYGSHLASALLDTGADTSIIRSDLAKCLGLSGEQVNVSLSTPIGNASKSCMRVSFRLKSLDGAELVEVERAFTVPSIVDINAEVPSKQVLSKWNHFDDINLNPLPTPVVGILLGLDVPDAHWIFEQRRGKKGEPYADLTPFGWVLRGPLDLSQQRHGRTFAMHLQQIENNIRRLFDQEFQDNGTFDLAPSAEDECAVDAVERSLEFKNGHLCVGLPWRDNHLRGCCNKPLALHRLSTLGRRLTRDLKLKQKYVGVIDRYLEKGYATKVVEEPKDGDCVKWYLPHHAVLNPKKPEKVRVVFDCAAVFKGESLNKHLLQGPNMVPNLIGIILRFRQRPIALSADIEDMFLQVTVPERDQNALRFLWWHGGDMTRTPEEFKLTVHPFGAVSSPFCASFALKKTATLFGHEYPPEVSQVLMNSFYVDDCLVSVNDMTEALSLIDGLSRLLKLGGFRLTKWSSNNREVLNTIPVDDRSSAFKNLSANNLPTQRVLGIVWNMESDTFRYEIQLDDTVITRRILLSRLASIYDPLGWISPFVLPMKLLFQDMCRKGIGWDERLDTSIQMRWQHCKEVLNGLSRIKIPRWYTQDISDGVVETELHVFCDASEVGYGCVAYFRFVYRETNPRCMLVMAKSRVAPLKTVTIPRLELTAAVTAVDISKVITREINVPLREIVFWTDSAVVLYYLNDSKSRFSTFVANRVSKIKEWSSPSQWRHVAGNSNPADIASRGMKPNSDKLHFWLNGPIFLENPGKLEPNSNITWQPLDELIEFKSVVTAGSVDYGFLTRYCMRFSSWHTLVKCVAWLLRFKKYFIILKKGNSDMCLRVGPLTVADMNLSRQEIVRLLQLESFGQEIELLRNSDGMRKRHLYRGPLCKLNPIMINGLLCVGGRLQWSSLSEDARHPVILPAKHSVTDMIIKYHHELEGHVGCSQVLATIRKRFWIVRGRAAVRRVLGKCLRCRRETVLPSYQQMAPLPIERSLSVGYAFAHVGVDYFGPLYVKRGRVSEKRYGCLFTCLNIRAVHIEVAHSLTTDSFLQAVTRFMARRGQPMVIFSDNGSNFKGAHSELRTCLKSFSHSEISQFLLKRDIDWHFGPPEASHWGGVWERLIRSTRRILRAIAYGQRMTDETLQTFLSEVERIMNNRPIVQLTDDARDLEVLTPSKLLILRDNETFMDQLNFSRSCLKLWRRVQVLADTFWKRWKTEYLSNLQERQKWFTRSREFKVGDLVLVVDDSCRRNYWPLGVIQEVRPSADGLVREVIVRTSHGTLRRDVRKVCLLEGDVG